jgi:type II secretory pathway component GspD/PulD (secretin)
MYRAVLREQQERGDMRIIGEINGRNLAGFAALAAACALTFMMLAPHAGAQANPPGSQPCEARPAPPPPVPETVQTIFLKNATGQNDLNDISTDLRNVLPRARIFPDQGQNAITVRATEEDLATAQKLIAELDLPRKVYRLTYTITDFENGKRTTSQHFVFLAVAGERTIFKQGSKVPIVIGTVQKETTAQSSEIQYQDVGLSIDATVSGSPENLVLHSKVEQSSLSGEKSDTVAPDPVFRQTVLQGSSALNQNKPLVLGSLDIPGTTGRQEIEVLAELVP